MTLKTKIILLVILLTALPALLSLLHYYSMKRELIQKALERNREIVEKLADRVDMYISETLHSIASKVNQYKGYGLNEREIIWKITGEVYGVFEGAFYSPEGKLITSASREKVNPNFPERISPEGRSKLLYTPYLEPYVRVLYKDEEFGITFGYYIFSLDLSAFWNRLVNRYKGLEAFLLDENSRLIAFPDTRFYDGRKIPLREGIYRSDFLGTDVIGTFAKSKGGKWIVYAEEPLIYVLSPLENYRKEVILAGLFTSFSGGILCLIIIIRIFKPLENFKDYVVSWAKENLSENLKLKDDVEIFLKTFRSLIKKVEEEKKIYEAFFKNSFDGVVLFDTSLKVSNVNENFCEIFQVKKDEVIGKSMEDLIGERLPLKNTFIREVELKLGKKHYCSLRQGILIIEDVPYVVWWLKDLSKEKELRGMLERTSKLAVAGEIACSLAHQLNTPLASIMGYAELLNLSEKDQRTKEKLDLIIKQAHRCKEIIGKMLYLGKVDSRPAYVNLEELILEVLEILEPKARKKGVNVRFENGDAGKIFGFPWQIEQILINILDNAIDALPEGESIYIKLKKEEEYVVLEVKDKGKGFEDPEKAFEPFYTTKQNGTGLGLSIVKTFVEGMNGKIEVKNCSGALVKVYLPEVAESERFGN
ncbi:ATP-binding protein [Aquifex aeolicus]|uniref:histidine kinase n=1 Tax=Aquifex aeolicus (strain VF5) TaxID=224324 RepID=O67197_AQUAE|nr:ATP-binding protein [Aquifex aeolicus]AAC07158.1 histidine kinase sensor protein [Aquifex aeolicus VF5]